MQEFLTNVGLVSQNVGVLFCLVAVGFVLNKTRMLSEVGAKNLSDLALVCSTPCVIINSFIRPYEPQLMGRYLLCLGATFLLHGLFIALAHLLVFSKQRDKTAVYRFAMIFSNAGYMALPLQQALLGEQGVFFSSAYLAGFNILLWTYGVWLMGREKAKITWTKLVFNPGLIAVFVGLLLFVCSIPVPTLLRSAIGHMANMNTAIPMIVIGYYVAKTDLLCILRQGSSLYTIFLRLIVLPVAGIGLLWLLGFRDVEFVCLSIAVCTPPAAATTMFAARYESDVELSAQLVSVGTLLSILTMPALIAFCMFIAG